MLITFHCSHCNAKLRIDADAMGSQLNCPECETHITVPHQEFGPGFVVGGFAIKRKIGEGGMGEVYLARQLSMERDVALKILPPQFTRKGNFVVRFLKEVHFQAKLDHPNIVTAFEAGEDNGIYFMAMAYVEGKTLEEHLEETGAISEAKSLDVVRQVGLALRYAAEEKAILHRDIKPGNIMVTPSGLAKVLDMGLSKSVYDAHPHTHADTLMGTPNYMSPEQIDTPQQIDTRADMFSLGMTLFHMLTGQVPFADSSYMQTLKRHGSEKLEDPRHLMPGISEGTARLLWRMVARDPADRFENWDALLRAVQAAKSGRPQEIAPPKGTSSIAYDPTLRAPPAPVVPRQASRVPRLRRRGVLQSVLAGLLLGMAGIAMISRWLPRRTSPPQPSASATPSPDAPALPEIRPTALPASREQAEFAEILLAYEAKQRSHDETLARLQDLGPRAEGTEVAVKTAQLILRVRQDRDAAMQTLMRDRQEQVLDLLRHHGADRAYAFLNETNGPFASELRAQGEDLRERVREWERQEQSQREETNTAAAGRFGVLVGQIAPQALQGKWEACLSVVDQAATNSLLFAAADSLAALRAEILSVQGVPMEILKAYQPHPTSETNIWLRSGMQTLRILEVRPGGLLTAKTLRDASGALMGSAEQVIPFSLISPAEQMRKMIPMLAPHHDLYRGLLAQRNGNPEAARHYYQQAGTPLAKALAALIPPATTPWEGPAPPSP